jgi:hypothetical protein
MRSRSIGMIAPLPLVSLNTLDLAFYGGRSTSIDCKSFLHLNPLH